MEKFMYKVLADWQAPRPWLLLLYVYMWVSEGHSVEAVGGRKGKGEIDAIVFLLKCVKIKEIVGRVNKLHSWSIVFKDCLLIKK